VEIFDYKYLSNSFEKIEDILDNKQSGNSTNGDI